MRAVGTRVDGPKCPAKVGESEKVARRCLERYKSALNACNAQLPK